MTEISVGRLLPLPPREMDARWSPVLRELRLQQVVLGVAFIIIALFYWVFRSSGAAGLQLPGSHEIISLLVAAFCWRHFAGQRRETIRIIINGVEAVATVDTVHRRPKGGHDLDITFEYDGRTIHSKAIQKTELIEKNEDGKRRVHILVDPTRPEKTALIPLGPPKGT